MDVVAEYERRVEPLRAAYLREMVALENTHNAAHNAACRARETNVGRAGDSAEIRNAVQRMAVAARLEPQQRAFEAARDALYQTFLSQCYAIAKELGLR